MSNLEPKSVNQVRQELYERTPVTPLNQRPLGELLTPQELARMWKVHPTTIMRRFGDMEGVLKMPGGKGRRKRVTMRIPVSLANKVMRELSR